MYHYDFSIAGLLLRVHSRYLFEDFYEASAFWQAYDPEAKPDAQYALEDLPEDWSVQGECLYAEGQSAVYKWQGQLHRYYYWSGREDRFVLVTCQENNLADYTIYIQKEDRERLLEDFRLTAFFFMEPVLLHHGALQLHASVVDWHDKGILFTAPSGVGKSTQAQLWKHAENASIINGDRGIVRLVDGLYRVYGSPYAGTSGIYVNRSVPVTAIVVLSQGQENRLEKLRLLAAFRTLYRETTVAAWYPGFVEKAAELLMAMLGEIPVYHLTCRPDTGAVEVLKAELERIER